MDTTVNRKHCRETANLEELLKDEGGILHQHKDNICIIKDPVTSSISSTALRRELAQVIAALVPSMPALHMHLIHSAIVRETRLCAAQAMVFHATSSTGAAAAAKRELQLRHCTNCQEDVRQVHLRTYSRR